MNITRFPDPVENAASLLSSCGGNFKEAQHLARLRFMDAPMPDDENAKDSAEALYWREVLQTLKQEHSFQC